MNNGVEGVFCTTLVNQLTESNIRVRTYDDNMNNLAASVDAVNVAILQVDSKIDTMTTNLNNEMAELKARYKSHERILYGAYSLGGLVVAGVGVISYLCFKHFKTDALNFLKEALADFQQKAATKIKPDIPQIEIPPLPMDFPQIPVPYPKIPITLPPIN
ncbi:uncharacterized protein LOC135836657 [Planococcus citri]|uniref:uncharacterized protein LOC135836657 n=1 Tax=Planococcus citri TaxID=170843 RepID=UPI0031F78834